MAILTPNYWTEEKYQPLTETETAYGNRVKIPKEMMETWEFWEWCRDLVLPEIEKAKAGGWFDRKISGRTMQDLKRVYFELYRE